MSNVSKVSVKNNLASAVEQAVDEIGGVGEYVKKGDTVLLKPNFNTADPFPASTDLEFLKVVTQLVFQQEPKQVIIGESSTMMVNTHREMGKLNVFSLAKLDPDSNLDSNSAPTIVNFDKEKWIKKEIPAAKYLETVSVPELLDHVDKLILLPCLKTHFLAQFTGSLKLSVGFMKPSERMALHARRLQEKIAELNAIIKPDLIIMDARKIFIDHGPSSGQVQEPESILASADRVALDIEGIKIIQQYEGNSLEGIDPEEIVQIQESQKSIPKPPPRR